MPGDAPFRVLIELPHELIRAELERQIGVKLADPAHGVNLDARPVSYFAQMWGISEKLARSKMRRLRVSECQLGRLKLYSVAAVNEAAKGRAIAPKPKRRQRKLSGLEKQLEASRLA